MKKILIFILLLVSFTTYSQVTLRKGFNAVQNGDTLSLIYSNGEWVLESDTSFKIVLDTLFFSDGTYQVTQGVGDTKDSVAVTYTATQKMITDSLEANIIVSDTAKIGYQITGNTIIDSNSITSDTVNAINIISQSSTANLTFGYNNTPLTTDRGTIAIGDRNLYLNTLSNYNIGIGYRNIYSTTTGGNSNIGIGTQNLYGTTTGDYNIGIGYAALYTNTTGNGNIGIGYYAGRYFTNPNNILVINSIDRLDENGDSTKSLIVGYQDSDTANQKLYINAQTYTNTLNLGNVELYGDTDTLKAPNFWARFKGLFVDSISTNKLNVNNSVSAKNAQIDHMSIDTVVSNMSVVGGDTVTGGIDLKDAIEAESFAQINFKDTTYTTHAEGRVYYNEGAKSLVFQNDISGFNHNLGYEFVRRVYNGTGSTIPSLKAVRRVGTYSNGDLMASVALAGNTTLDSAQVYGITTVSIPPGSIGIVTRGGDIRSENTTSINDTTIYLGFGGELIDTCPNPPYLCVQLGECIYSDNDSGQVDVDIKQITYSPSPLHTSDTSGLNQVVTINTQNVYEYLPFSNNIVSENIGFTIAGDSIQVNVSGYYQLVLSMSFQGTASGATWKYGIFINDTLQHVKTRSTSSSSTGDTNVPMGRRLEKDDWVSFRITNTTGTTDPTIVDMGIQILFLHL